MAVFILSQENGFFRQKKTVIRRHSCIAVDPNHEAEWTRGDWGLGTGDGDTMPTFPPRDELDIIVLVTSAPLYEMLVTETTIEWMTTPPMAEEPAGNS